MLTFAAGHSNFESARVRIFHDGVNSKFFKKIIAHNWESVAKQYPAFTTENQYFINQNTRGYGHWIWKPFLIMKTLSEMNDGEYLLYLDAGCEINYQTIKAKQKWKKYIKATSRNTILAFQLKENQFENYPNLSEECFTRRDLIGELNVSDTDLLSNQIESGVIMFHANNLTRNFVAQWYELSIKNGREYLSEPPAAEKFLNYVDYRYDQAIFSALFKKHGFSPLLNENYFSPYWTRTALDYPIWTCRNISGLSVRPEK